ncbi:MAG TPA: HEAT repeat domain-containing protein [Myxococcota bacterium]|nr:HEAT repeat domain-containing protein [Myxococcota bacterium]HRY94685.1 HEAT repeat domain-containing protein [Myxococcota bacterium]HSA23596.1 HEAT repeat domain-containing protein [Myxococcota bacterium]
MTTWLNKIAGVRPEEGRRTLLATLFYFFFVAQVVMVKSASNALFLSRHNPRHLPYLYIGVALAVAIAVAFASRTLADPRRRSLRLWSLGAVALIQLACWVLLRFDLLPLSPFVYLFGEVASTALSIQFWSVAGDIFDPQEGKRVFGVLAGGGMSGSIFGGLFVHHLGPPLGTVQLLLAAALSLGVCLVLAWLLTKQRGRTDGLREVPTPSLAAGVKHVASHSYARTFGLLMLLSMVLTSFVDYFFRTSARTFLGEDQLAVLFGDLNTYVGVISVAFLFLVSSRILKRIGIFYYLMLVPAGLIAVAGVSVLVPAFWAIYAMKIVENAGSLSINQAGLQLLYNPVPAVLRAPVRGVVDGLMRKLGYAVGGALLLVLAPLLAPPAWQLIIAGLVVAYVALLVRLKVLYVSALDERLRVGARGPVELRVEDKSARQALERALGSADEAVVLTALQLVADAPAVDLRAQLKGLLSHPSEAVRLAAVEAVGKRGYQEFLFELLAMINAGTRRCRVAAIRAIVAIDPERSSGALAPYLRADEPGLVSAAIAQLVSLRGYGADNPAVPVLEHLLELGVEASPAQRRETAKLLGTLGDGRYTLHLGAYLEDPDPSVRRLAAQACGRLKRPEFVERLLILLSDRDARQAASQALAAYGDQVIDVLRAWLDDRSRPLAVRLRLPRVIRTIGTQAASETLLFSNIQDDAFLRYRIALALSGIRLQHPEVQFDRKWALEAVDRRAESYRFYGALYERVARHLPPKALVLRALRDRLVQNLEVAFRVLGLTYPHRTIMSVHARFRSASRDSQSDALELLDNVLDRESRERLMPLLERHHAVLAVEPLRPEDIGLERVASELVTLSQSKDPLLHATAVHTRCRLGDGCSQEYRALYEGVSTMEIMDKVLFLESVDIFQNNNLDDLTALAAIARPVRFKAGDHVLKEGEPGDALYIITQGQVDIVRGTRKLLCLGERKSLGGVSLLDQKPHAASAVCATDCEALVIERPDFLDLLSDRVELLHGIFLALTDRLRALLAVTETSGLADEQYDDGPTNPV